MTIVHLNQHLERKGGVETYLLDLLPRLEQAGGEQVWLYSEGHADLWANAQRVEGLGATSTRADKATYERVRAVLHDRQPDVVHVHNLQNVGAIQAALDYGPTVMTSHDYRAVCPANTFFFRRTQSVCHKQRAGIGCFGLTALKHCLTPRPHYAWYYYHRARALTGRREAFALTIAPSPAAQRRLLNAGFPAARVQVLPYYCPIPPAEQPRPVPARPVITFLGRATPNKGVEVFIKALGQLPGVQGVMIGGFSGPVRETVVRAAEDAGCADRLELRAWASREEVLDHLDRTSVLVFPSLWPETLGIVALEAMARGVPVVASTIVGVAHWIEDGGNGGLVPPGDAEAVAAGVRRLLAPDTLRAAGAQSIASVRRWFMPGDHVRALQGFYEQAVSRSSSNEHPLGRASHG